MFPFDGHADTLHILNRQHPKIIVLQSIEYNLYKVAMVLDICIN